MVVISYSAILIVFCTFKLSSMTLSLSLSLHHVQWMLCYRIKNIYILHGIYKATEANDLNVAIQTGALPSNVRVVG